MKKHLYTRLLATIMLLVLLAGCKKNNVTPQEDLNFLFTNTVWTGEFKEALRPQEPFSIYFDDIGGFIWQEQRGLYTGKYSINAKTRTISFQFPKGDFTAKILKNQLSEFTGSLIEKPLSCELNKQADNNVDNSEWKGLYNEVGGNPSLFFYDKNQGLMVDGGYSGFSPIPYTRRSCTFRYEFLKDPYTYIYFSVIIPMGK
ncbi:hypothetical protein [Pedobacter sp. NJ-S-72]